MKNFLNNYWKRIGLKKSIIYVSFFFIIFVFILASGYFLLALKPVSQERVLREIEIKEGESFRQITENLWKTNIIRSTAAFKILSLLSGAAHKFKPGIYYLDTALPATGVLKSLVAGPNREREVVIQEGLTLLDIDRKLNEAGVLPLNALSQFNLEAIKGDYEFLHSSEGKEIKSLEGYLFPDTYKFFINSKPETVVRKFLDNFNSKAWPLLKNRSLIAGKNVFGSNQFLIIASLIEKEVYYDKEKPIVSGIIYKRLNIGMPLQIDATVTYAKCKGFIFYCDKPAVLRGEISFSSPYNTYLYQGLPPTPISNPGITSITAAFNPEKSDYLYYLSDPKTKSAVFSKTLEEHNENRGRYLGL